MKPIRGMLLAAVLTSFAPSAAASLGFELIGYGAESVSMGGADVAVSRDSNAVNNNPAGLTQIGHKAADFYVVPYFCSCRHSDQYGNDNVLFNNHLGGVLGLSYAQRLPWGSGLVAGIGVFAQGGSGFTYKNIRTAFATTDELSSMVSIGKIAPSLAWAVNDRLSVGLTTGVAYASGRQKFFPNTSVQAASFYGFRFDGGKAWSPNVTLGLQYRWSPQLTVGAEYSSKTPLPLKGGSLLVNYSAIDAGYVRYDKAELDGLALPQALSLGFAYTPTKPLLLSFEVRWLDWSGALKSTTLVASDPDSAAVPASISESSALNWRDQYVFALGAAYNLGPGTVVRAGFNIEKEPVPPATLTPILNLLQRREVDFGFAQKIGRQWLADFALEYEPLSTVRYTNTQAPFGVNAEEKFQGVLFTASISRRWQ